MSGQPIVGAATALLGTSSAQVATTAFVQNTNASTAAITLVTTAATTTVSAQEQTYRVLSLNGKLTADHALILPNTGNWYVSNISTGAFVLTCKTAAGSGVTVAAGGSKAIVCDGTNATSGVSDTGSYLQTVPLASTVNSGYPDNSTYFGYATTVNGFPINGAFSGARYGLIGTQRLQGELGTQVWIRVWNNGSPGGSWNPWVLLLDSEDFTAKGQISVGTAINAYAMLGVGTDGQVLTASAAAATGLVWASPVVGANDRGTYVVQTATNAPANAQVLAALATSILKVTTTTGVLSAAVAADFPVLNQNTTGTAATITGALAATSLPALSGDATSVAGAAALTLATVNANVGVFTSFTVNAKGLITAATNPVVPIRDLMLFSVQATATAVTSTATAVTGASLIEGTNFLWSSAYIRPGGAVFLEILASSTAGSPIVILTALGATAAVVSLTGTASTTTVRTRSVAITALVSGTEYQIRLYNSVAGTASLKLVRIVCT